MDIVLDSASRTLSADVVNASLELAALASAAPGIPIHIHDVSPAVMDAVGQLCVNHRLEPRLDSGSWRDAVATTTDRALFDSLGTADKLNLIRILHHLKISPGLEVAMCLLRDHMQSPISEMLAAMDGVTQDEAAAVRRQSLAMRMCGPVPRALAGSAASHGSV